MDEDFTESDINENTLEDSSTKKRKLEVAFVGDVVKLSKIVDVMRRAKRRKKNWQLLKNMN